jgi:hypothetical protein
MIRILVPIFLVGLERELEARIKFPGLCRAKLVQTKMIVWSMGINISLARQGSRIEPLPGDLLRGGRWQRVHILLLVKSY